MENTMLRFGTISAEDVRLATLTDDPGEVVEIVDRHRDWKMRKIEEAAKEPPGKE